MHRDTKIGLAMAILIVGFAAALCFPNRPAAGRPIARAGELDQQIQLLPVHAYTGLDYSSATEVAVVEPSPVLADAGPPPKAIRLPMLEATTALPPVAHTESKKEPRPRQATVAERVYVVRAGDTLSAVAAKYLGSRSRYDEIYEANRDQLTSPDALAVGMRLQIPSKNDGNEERQTRTAEE